MLNIRRGEIYFCDLGEGQGSIQGGYRPVLIIQSDKINNVSPTVLVAPITSVIKREELYSHMILNSDCGLDKLSMVLFEQLRTVNACSLKKYIGKVDGKESIRVMNNSIKKTLGLWHYKEERTGDVRCLCKRHLDEYKTASSCMIKRLQPTQVIKEKCDKCNNFGYDYIFYDKEEVLRKRGSSYGK